MQLARNLFPQQLPMQEKTLRRKLAEMHLARQMEAHFSKQKILELYLNHIYLGSGAYGIEAAARTYFGKSAAQLSTAAAATLAALPTAPSYYDPRRNADAALRRRNLVLEEAPVLDGDEGHRDVAREGGDRDDLAPLPVEHPQHPALPVVDHGGLLRREVLDLRRRRAPAGARLRPRAHRDPRAARPHADHRQPREHEGPAPVAPRRPDLRAQRAHARFPPGAVEKANISHFKLPR
jgi:hypothetical protein